jgi:hypothetical protein
VGDLVTDHARELVLAVGEQQQSAGDEDVATGQSEGIRLLHVDHAELIVESPSRDTAQQLMPDAVDIGGEGGVVEHA